MPTEYVSVLMLSYNHSQYISQAIESVLMQKTNFSYRIFIGDDRSTDNTQEIIASYAQKYPDIISPVLRKKNLGMNENFVDMLSRCKGKYIAYLEGDDYWTDDKKLQMQVDFLDSNSTFTAVTTQCRCISFDGTLIESIMKRYCNKKEYTKTMLKNYKLPGHMCTWLMRNIFPIKEFPINKMLNYPNCTGDRLFPILLLKAGRIGCLPMVTCSYRFDQRQESSSWSSKHASMLLKGSLEDFDRLVELEDIAAYIGMPIKFWHKKIEYYAMALYYYQIHHNNNCKLATKDIQHRIGFHPLFYIKGYLYFFKLCMKSILIRIHKK